MKINIKKFIAIIGVCLTFIYFFNKNSPQYTHEELYQMPPNVLLNIFNNNGLLVPHHIKEFFDNSDDKLASFLKENFELFSQGISSYGYTEYSELADSFKDIYNKLLK